MDVLEALLRGVAEAIDVAGGSFTMRYATLVLTADLAGQPGG